VIRGSKASWENETGLGEKTSTTNRLFGGAGDLPEHGHRSLGGNTGGVQKDGLENRGGDKIKANKETDLARVNLERNDQVLI